MVDVHAWPEKLKRLAKSSCDSSAPASTLWLCALSRYHPLNASRYAFESHAALGSSPPTALQSDQNSM